MYNRWKERWVRQIKSMFHISIFGQFLKLFWVVGPCGAVGVYQYSSDIMVSAYKTIQRHKPEQHNRHLHYCEDLEVKDVLQWQDLLMEIELFM
jgi:hypothetical protein